MLKKIAIGLVPLALLLLYTCIACVIGYGIFIFINGAAELHRIISRVTQALLILSIYPAMCYLHISAKQVGFVRFRQFLKQMSGGIILGLCTLLPVLLLSYALDITVFDATKVWTPEKVLVKLLAAFALAVLISLLEEPMFRGILISAYLKRLGIAATIFISSFYYAILHFIKARTAISVRDVRLTDGFYLALEALQNLLKPEHLGALWALMMVGVFLAVMRTRLQLSLAWCIGCHAAWVWQIKMAHQLVSVNPHSDLIYLVSPYDGVIGPMVAMWLTLVVIAYFMYEKFFSK
ncbi:MAG: CPBP family intramembrane metalloprotease [Methyloprofundus sp.]|nr:CPBP family intramembrane metalloprotease [Methyloprofundus sp.]MBW6452309.1 CPBP family intramembrane metalloprotease [Methyloprofundus sp.]